MKVMEKQNVVTFKAERKKKWLICLRCANTMTFMKPARPAFFTFGVCLAPVLIFQIANGKVQLGFPVQKNHLCESGLAYWLLIPIPPSSGHSPRMISS